VLEELARQGHELPRVVLGWRQLQKLTRTYTESLLEQLDPATSRVHTHYMLTSTSTGRLSSTDPNLQNIPIRTEEGRKIREAFVPEPGFTLMSADYSQIELRILAHVADITPLKEAFANDIDIHAVTASQMFGVPVAEVKGDLRRSAKTINYGIVYGIGAFGLAQRLGIPQPWRATTSSSTSASTPASATTWSARRSRRASTASCGPWTAGAATCPTSTTSCPRAAKRRAAGDQRADPGHGCRHREARDGPGLAGAQARGQERGCCSRSTTSSCWRCGGEVEATGELVARVMRGAASLSCRWWPTWGTGTAGRKRIDPLEPVREDAERSQWVGGCRRAWR
jgi:hypothetical protein